jgi:signal transduction histidine kinase
VLPAWLNLDSCSVIRLATLVLSLAIAAYLTSRKARSRATVFLALTFYGAALFNLASFLEFAGFYYWQPRNLKNLLVPLFQYLGPAGALAALVFFAYCFPCLPARQKREMQAVGAVLAALNLGMLVFTVCNFLLLERIGSNYALEMAYYSSLYGFLGVQGMFVVVLLLRRSVLLAAGKSRPWWRRLLRPESRSAATARSLGLNLLLLPVAIGGYVLMTYGFLSLPLATYLVWLFFLLFYFGFVVTYLNHAIEPSTFQVKLVGLTLIPVLSLLGLAALFVGNATEKDYPATGRLPSSQTLLFRPNAAASYDITALPFRFQTDLGRRLDIGYGERRKVQFRFDFAFFGRSYRSLHVLHNPLVYLGEAIREEGWGGYHPNPAIAPLLLNLDPTRGGGIYLSSGPESLTLTWFELPELGLDNANTVQLTLNSDGSFTMSFGALNPQGRYSSVQMYNFTLATTTGRNPGSLEGALAYGPKLTGVHPGFAAAPLHALRFPAALPYSSPGPEVLFDSYESDYYRYLHSRMSVLALLLLAASLFILFVFPILFRTNLIRPLQSLADGMRRADRGDLGVRVQPRFRDEIGFLTRSFNKMLKSIQRTEASLMQANRLNSLGILLTAMAHQINVPNQSILANASLLAKACPDLMHILEDCAPETAGYLIGGLEDVEFRRMLPESVSAIQAGSRSIAGIIQDLRAFSQKEFSVEPSSLDMGAVIRSAVGLAGGYLRRATDRFALQVAPGLPRVRGYGQRLEQALVNLLINACQALPDRSRGIELGADRVEAREEVFVRIADEGCGIPAEHLPHLKERFFTTRRAAGGTGLGLFIADTIITEHHGSLELASVPGRGTVATVILPTEAYL